MITKLRIGQTQTKFIKGQWMDHITTGDTRIYLFGFIRIWKHQYTDQILYDSENNPINNKRIGFTKGTQT